MKRYTFKMFKMFLSTYILLEVKTSGIIGGYNDKLNAQVILEINNKISNFSLYSPEITSMVTTAPGLRVKAEQLHHEILRNEHVEGDH